MNKKKIMRITQMLDIPEEVVSNVPKITIIGFNEMMIENYKNIIEYEEFFIKVNTYIGTININGFNLKLIKMNRDDMKIVGRIDNVDFESYEDETEV